MQWTNWNLSKIVRAQHNYRMSLCFSNEHDLDSIIWRCIYVALLTKSGSATILVAHNIFPWELFSPDSRNSFHICSALEKKLDAPWFYLDKASLGDGPRRELPVYRVDMSRWLRSRLYKGNPHRSQVIPSRQVEKIGCSVVSSLT